MASTPRKNQSSYFTGSKIEQYPGDIYSGMETSMSLESIEHRLEYHTLATAIATNKVVGIDDEAEKIMEVLLGGPKRLEVISIVGMPGLGKTTLAKKMYWDPLLIDHFDVRAWCSVSQTTHKKELLLRILGDVVTVTNEICKLNDQQLAEMLFQNLKGRRYLVVIDDMWEIEGWDALKRSLPDDEEYSRILITSRHQNMASKIEVVSKVHALRPLTDAESWELFRTRLVERESFSLEFLEVGEIIARNCSGLPLAIVAMAEYLAHVKSVEEWKQFAGHLSSHIMNDPKSQCREKLELGYDRLPDHLRSCFLYIGAFSKHEDISTCKLKLLWIAEGFIDNTQTECLEDKAEECLMELINNSLLIAAKERSLGGVKVCRINDFLHDFCLGKAKEESFLHVIHKDHCTSLRGYDHCRLSIYSKEDALMWVRAIDSNVRSLLVNATNKDNFYCNPHDVSFIFQNFKLLMVLDIACIFITESFSAIELLIHLRYLAVGARTTCIPSSISNLWNLQSFLVRFYYDSEVIDIPDSLWDMVNLRHVYISHYASFDVQASRLVNSSLLDNLKTLSGPCLSYGEDAENLLRRLPELRKLRCVFRGINAPGRDFIMCCRFPELHFLHQLLSLKVTFEGSLHWGTRCEFHFPLNLQKLTFSNFRLSWDEISKIGSELPNLKVLKLIGVDWDDTWIVSDGDFPNLKYLKLSSLTHTVEWIASDYSFCNLKQLVLDNCPNLNEVPACFEDIPTLQMIVVKDCKASVENSVRNIQMVQREWQNIDLKVYIT